MIYVVELCSAFSTWLPHSWHRNFAQMLTLQQMLEYRCGLPCRVREVEGAP